MPALFIRTSVPPKRRSPPARAGRTSSRRGRRRDGPVLTYRGPLGPAATTCPRRARVQLAGANVGQHDLHAEASEKRLGWLAKPMPEAAPVITATTSGAAQDVERHGPLLSSQARFRRRLLVLHQPPVAGLLHVGRAAGGAVGRAGRRAPPRRGRRAPPTSAPSAAQGGRRKLDRSQRGAGGDAVDDGRRRAGCRPGRGRPSGTPRATQRRKTSGAAEPELALDLPEFRVGHRRPPAAASTVRPPTPARGCKGRATGGGDAAALALARTSAYMRPPDGPQDGRDGRGDEKPVA